MPPVEGLKLGAVVITTNETSIPEVTCGKAFYVKDPYNVLEWIDVIKDESNKHRKCYEFSCYEKDIISKEYINLLSNDGSI